MAPLLRLCEGEAGLVVHLEDLLDGVDVGGRAEVQAQVVLAGRAHDLLKEQKGERHDSHAHGPRGGRSAHPCRPLHGVGQPRVDDVLLRRPLQVETGVTHTAYSTNTTRGQGSTHSDSGLEVGGRNDGDGSTLLPKLPLQTLLHRHYGDKREMIPPPGTRNQEAASAAAEPQSRSSDTMSANKYSFFGRLWLTQQVVVGVPLVFEGQSSVADVVQVLQPLEVGHGHAAGVQIHVLQHTRSSNTRILQPD